MSYIMVKCNDPYRNHNKIIMIHYIPSNMVNEAYRQYTNKVSALIKLIIFDVNAFNEFFVLCKYFHD